ncbi:MAG: UpxY family transcription antiterminator [Proteobacteria bacterium]|nr:UpxY family transcription antiterminator [Pseudomonadota bacterium]
MVARENSANDQNPQWYAVHVRSNQEQKTASFIKDRGIELFMPTYRVRSKRMDRHVTLVKPLFVGYLFVHVDYRAPERIQILKAPGTVRIVGFGEGPTPIPEERINSLKILIGGGEDCIRPHPLVRAGNAVRVIDGPFSGATGVLHETEGRKSRLVVEVEFLGRAVAVPISKDQVQPVFG